MKQETLELLKKYDDHENWEYPSDFNWSVEIKKVEELIPYLKELIGKPIVLDDKMQDASFFAELSHDEDLSVSGFNIRFSAFGNLFTLWQMHNSFTVTPEVKQKVIDFVSSKGFTYIDPTDLGEEYPGKEYGIPSICTWWDRYFDWL